jgi:hypothetical protein
MIANRINSSTPRVMSIMGLRQLWIFPVIIGARIAVNLLAFLATVTTVIFIIAVRNAGEPELTVIKCEKAQERGAALQEITAGLYGLTNSFRRENK